MVMGGGMLRFLSSPWRSVTQGATSPAGDFAFAQLRLLCVGGSCVMRRVAVRAGACAHAGGAGEPGAAANKTNHCGRDLGKEVSRPFVVALNTRVLPSCATSSTSYGSRRSPYTAPSIPGEPTGHAGHGNPGAWAFAAGLAHIAGGHMAFPPRSRPPGGVARAQLCSRAQAGAHSVVVPVSCTVKAIGPHVVHPILRQPQLGSFHPRRRGWQASRTCQG